jgi:hypothetical protein
MILRRLSLLVLACAVGVVLAAPASAQQTKPKKQVQTRSAPAAQHRGTDKFPAGPLYYADVWLGDDPDPFIRLQIQRDLTARFGGNF